MNVNIDEAVAINDALPWDFGVTVRGETYKTRPILNKDLIYLTSVMPGLPRETQYQYIADLFVGIKPNVAGWDQHEAEAVIAAIVGHVRGRASKNFQRVVDQVASATRR